MRDHLDCGFDVKEVAEDGSFSGYGSVFGNIDSYKEIVSSGAFDESLRDWKSKGRMPSLLWQHRAGEPIGVYASMHEDANGLFVKGKLALKTARGAEAYELLKMGAISGLSIGFQTREDSFDKVSGIRTLKKVDLWEVSLVTFPANDAARISVVKSIEQINSIRDCESYLREAGGLSKSESLAFIAKIKSIARSESEDEAKIIAALTKRGNSINSLA